MIHNEKKFNKRHITVIIILSVLFLGLQYLPYVAFWGEKTEGAHSECVELSRLPGCADETGSYAYTVSEGGTRLDRIKKYNTCSEYLKNPVMVPRLPEWACMASALIVIIEIFIAAILLLVGLFKGMVFIFGWLSKPIREEVEIDEEDD